MAFHRNIRRFLGEQGRFDEASFVALTASLRRCGSACRSHLCRGSAWDNHRGPFPPCNKCTLFLVCHFLRQRAYLNLPLVNFLPSPIKVQQNKPQSIFGLLGFMDFNVSDFLWNL